MKVMKDMMKKIRSKGRMDAENRWSVAQLLAADREKAWLQSRKKKKKKLHKNRLNGWKMKKEDDSWLCVGCVLFCVGCVLFFVVLCCSVLL